MLTTFGHEISDDMVERGDRLAEEVFELLQSKGYDFGRLVQLMAYVDGRPTGDPKQEVGGVMVTLAAFCTAAKLDMYEAGWEELSRVWDNIVQIRAKQRSKAGICTPLPVPPEVARAATAPDGTDWVTRASEFASVALGNAQEVCRLHARVRELEAECARWATGAHGQ